MQRSCSYLIKDPYSYYFRIRVPKDIQAIISKKELRYSLGTSSLSAAKTKARFMAGQYQLLFRDIRQMEFTKEQILKLITDYKDKVFDQYDKPVMYGQYAGDSDPELDMTAEYQWVDGYKRWYHQCLILGDYSGKLFDGDSSIEQKVDDLLIKQGVSQDDIDKTSPEYSALCAGLLRAEIKGLDRYEKRLNGVYSDDLEGIFGGNLSSAPTPFQATMPEAMQPTKTISQVIQEKIEEVKRENPKISEKDLNRTKASMDLLTDYFEDAPIHSITRPMMAEYKKDLFKIPARRNSFNKYKGKSLKQILTMNPKEKPFHNNTVWKHFYNASRVFEFAEVNGIIETDPTKKMKVKKIETEGHPFDQKELEKIFYSIDYKEDKHGKSFQFWLPIMALFTGARLEEIASLRLKDFELHGEIWCINVIEDTEENKRLKNKASRRLIPLHPFLVNELGIIRKRDKLKRQRKQKFFPELKKNSENKYGTQVTGWFTSSFKKRVGIPNGVGKNFHSFRHNFQDNLKQQMVNLTIIDDLAGHKTPGESMGTYATKHSVENGYNEGILKLKYDLDLSHLKDSKWVAK